jgi:hypothetical protein
MITSILCKQGEFPPLDIEDLTEEQAVSLLCDLRLLVLKNTSVAAIEGYSQRAVNVLLRNNLQTVGDVLDLPPSKIAKLPGLGPRVREDIRTATEAWIGRPLRNWNEAEVSKFQYKGRGVSALRGPPPPSL